MTEEKNSWYPYEECPYSLREALFYHNGITHEEYVEEREYYEKCLSEHGGIYNMMVNKKYKPLWKQRQEKKE